MLDNSCEGTAAIDAQATGREETVRFAAGTVLGENDVLDWNSSSCEDCLVGGTQVNVCLTCSCIALDNRLKVEMSFIKSLHHLIAYLKTVLADAGSHRGLNAVSTGTLAAHLLDRFGCNPSYCSPPARMSHGDDTRTRVGQDDGHAVGGVHPND